MFNKKKHITQRNANKINIGYAANLNGIMYHSRQENRVYVYMESFETFLVPHRA